MYTGIKRQNYSLFCSGYYTTLGYTRERYYTIQDYCILKTVPRKYSQHRHYVVYGLVSNNKYYNTMRFVVDKINHWDFLENLHLGVSYCKMYYIHIQLQPPGYVGGVSHTRLLRILLRTSQVCLHTVNNVASYT